MTQSFTGSPVATGVARGATVRIGPLAAIPALLKELGADPVPVLREAGFDPGYFDSPDLPVSYRAAGRLLARAAAASGCDHFGLLVGARSGPTMLGIPGLLMTLAPDVGSALEGLRQYFSLHDRGGGVVLDIDAGHCTIGYRVVEPGVEGADQIHDLALAIAFNMLRALCGPTWVPDAVRLPRRRPRDARPWTDFFGVSVAFGAPQSAIRFPRRWLATPLTTGDRAIYGLVRRHADAARAESDADPLAEVRRVLRGCIAEGGGHESQVARLLGVHPRTLSRRLAAAGTTFRHLRDEALHAMALQLLEETSMPIGEAATALGFSDATAFIRAFRRWTGKTPGQWRREASRGAR